jgi:hypothetical protein
VRPYKVTVSHAIPINKDQIISGCLPDSLIQDSRFPEADILLPNMYDGKDILQHIPHLIHRIPSFGRTPVIGDQDL